MIQTRREGPLRTVVLDRPGSRNALSQEVAVAFVRRGQRVATPDATFAESGVSLGLFGAWGGTVRLPAVVGPGHALGLALSGWVRQ